MEQRQTGKAPLTTEELVIFMAGVGRERAMQRQALEDVTQELRGIARRASSLGVSDAQIARASGASLTTVRQWLGKRH